MAEDSTWEEVDKQKIEGGAHEMFTTIARYFKKYKRFLTINILALIFLFSYSLYIHHEVSVTSGTQKEIIEFIKVNLKDQNEEKIKTHAIAIQQKIDEYKRTGNQAVDESTLDLYAKAFELASEGDKLCYVVEDMADGMIKSYKEGVKDGNKMWGKRITQS